MFQAIALILLLLLSGCASTNDENKIYQNISTDNSVELIFVNAKLKSTNFVVYDNKECMNPKAVNFSVGESGKDLALRVMPNQHFTFMWEYGLSGNILGHHNWCRAYYTILPNKGTYVISTNKLDNNCGINVYKKVSGSIVSMDASEQLKERIFTRPMWDNAGPYCEPTTSNNDTQAEIK
ncbi:hypothetical protein [Planctobacterium marinum]|uniref:hypothetical protein n=1 Tax=Planctobacterium marinum TaxID=1631968 RepID=UPI001E55FF1E|nr:hypothetical protein [Planctobacterium marinum]MCC2607549.1 hypothetical protein [Planctobacterium marinum]